MAPLRAFFYTARGSGSLLLERADEMGLQPVGVCARPDRHPAWEALRRGAGGLRRVWPASSRPFFHRNPNAACGSPRAWARQHGIPAFGLDWVASPAAEETLRKLNADLAVVCGFSRILPEPLIHTPRLGTINFHPSLLPRHRGATPQRWVIAAGEASTGVTAHLVAKRIDAGAIVDQESVAVADDETEGSLLAKLADASMIVARRVFDQARQGRWSPRAQDEMAATQDPPWRQEDSRVDWRASAASVARLCRCAQPNWGGIFSLNGRLFCAWDVKPEDAIPEAPPGTLLRCDSDGVTVQCGQGRVVIRSVLSPSGRIVPARAYRRLLRPGLTCDPARRSGTSACANASSRRGGSHKPPRG